MRLDARTDFRLEKLAGSPVYHVPADERARAALDEAFRKLTGRRRGEPAQLTVKGRIVEVPEAAGGVARFSFADLCAQPLGAADYLAVAQDFHTLILDDIPRMGFERRNEAKRFIILIDALYEHPRQAPRLRRGRGAGPLRGARPGREAFEFDRTVSRLIEMRSEEYLSLPHGREDQGAGDTTGLVET